MTNSCFKGVTGCAAVSTGKTSDTSESYQSRAKTLKNMRVFVFTTNSPDRGNRSGRGSKGKGPTEYRLTLVLAKRISMMEGGEMQALDQ
jgi:hypothetical protein